jgi:adhesin HecA-like repeat protein
MPRLYLAGATLEDLSKTPQAFLSAQNITINSNGTIVNSGTITSQDDTHITASNIVVSSDVAGCVGNILSIDVDIAAL